ncbi:hypothetical protein DZS_26400 [Dickeya ananatis]
MELNIGISRQWCQKLTPGDEEDRVAVFIIFSFQSTVNTKVIQNIALVIGVLISGINQCELKRSGKT